MIVTNLVALSVYATLHLTVGDVTFTLENFRDLCPLELTLCQK